MEVVIMKLYRNRIPEIAIAVIGRLMQDGDIEVEPHNKDEAEQDLISIMEEYLRRDMELRNNARDMMSRAGIGADQYPKIRSRMAEEWRHPTGDDVERFLARQFVEAYMISRFVEEVYTADHELWKKTLTLIKFHDVDERELRDEARGLIKNINEGTVEYEMAFSRALRDVRKRRGLI
jgi:hypothetical protein